MKRQGTVPGSPLSHGQVLVEFALVLPVALLVLLAVFDVGRAVFMYNSLTNAAREGARLAIVNQDKALVAQRVQETVFGASVSNLGNLDDLVSFYREKPNLDDPTANLQCTPATASVPNPASPMARGCVAVVTARADWSPITPIIGFIIGPINMTARSELPVEFVCPNPRYTSYLTSDLCPKRP